MWLWMLEIKSVIMTIITLKIKFKTNSSDVVAAVFKRSLAT